MPLDFDLLTNNPIAVDSVAAPPQRRIPTRPTLASRRRRTEAKIRRAEVKSARTKVPV